MLIPTHPVALRGGDAHGYPGRSGAPLEGCANPGWGPALPLALSTTPSCGLGLLPVQPEPLSQGVNGGCLVPPLGWCWPWGDKGAGRKVAACEAKTPVPDMAKCPGRALSVVELVGTVDACRAWLSVGVARGRSLLHREGIRSGLSGELGQSRPDAMGVRYRAVRVLRAPDRPLCLGDQGVFRTGLKDLSWLV